MISSKHTSSVSLSNDERNLTGPNAVFDRYAQNWNGVSPQDNTETRRHIRAGGGPDSQDIAIEYEWVRQHCTSKSR